MRGTPALVTPKNQAAGVAGTGRILHLGRSTLRYAGFMRQAEERCRLLICLLYVCADFTSSAPLGSQSDDSLLRRSLSSPYLDYNMRDNRVKFCTRMTEVLLKRDFVGSLRVTHLESNYMLLPTS